jgi:hypothetical protein
MCLTALRGRAVLPIAPSWLKWTRHPRHTTSAPSATTTASTSAITFNTAARICPPSTPSSTSPKMSTAPRNWLFRARGAAAAAASDEATGGGQPEAKRSRSVEKTEAEADEATRERRGASPKWRGKQPAGRGGGRGAHGQHVRRRDKSADGFRGNGESRNANMGGQGNGRVSFQEDAYHEEDEPDYRPRSGGSLASRLAALEKRVGNVESWQSRPAATAENQ